MQNELGKTCHFPAFVFKTMKFLGMGVFCVDLLEKSAYYPCYTNEQEVKE